MNMNAIFEFDIDIRWGKKNPKSAFWIFWMEDSTGTYIFPVQKCRMLLARFKACNIYMNDFISKNVTEHWTAESAYTVYTCDCAIDTSARAKDAMVYIFPLLL